MTHPLSGRKQSPEHIAKRSAAIRAGGGFQLDAARDASADLRRGKPLSAEHRAKIGEKSKGNKSNLGKPQSAEHKAKISAALKGKRNSLGTKRSVEFRRKLADYWAANREKHNHYIDGKYSERRSVRGGLEYRLWREAVFRRDDWTCVECGARGNIHAHHIKQFALYPELRHDLSNGQTLCVPCHEKTPTYRKQVKVVVDTHADC